MSKRTYCADDKCEFEVYAKNEVYSKEEVYTKAESFGQKISATDFNTFLTEGFYVFNTFVDYNTSINTYHAPNYIYKGSTLQVLEAFDSVVQTFKTIDGTEYTRNYNNSITEWSVWTKKYEVITGTITLPGSTSETTTGITTVNYPAGFSKDNCVITSLMARKTGAAVWHTTRQDDAVSYIQGTGNLQAVLGEDNITIREEKLDGPTSSYTVEYKLVLMKISN